MSACNCWPPCEGVCDELMKDRAKLDNYVRGLEKLQDIVEYAAVHAESDEEFGRMVREGCMEHKRSKNDE